MQQCQTLKGVIEAENFIEMFLQTARQKKNGFNRITISNDKINRMVTIVPFGDVMPYRVRI